MTAQQNHQSHTDQDNQSAWRRTRALYERAIELQPKDRAAFLDQNCPDQPTRREVEDLANLDGAAAEHFSRLAASLGRGLVQRRRQPAIDLIGKRVAGYRILDVLGRGGMGIVYLAHRFDGTSDRPVALKLLPAWIASPNNQQRFRDERRILARLRHDSIARLLDGGVSDDGRAFIAMEYVDGLPIDFWCDAAVLNLHQRLSLFGDVCDTVEFAHRNQVVHCDVKPSNVLVTGGSETRPLGRVKLLDFGVARRLSRETTRERDPGPRMMPLTPAWASPEQLAGRQVTAATDVYALTALLYRLLVGVPPYDFHGRSVHEMREQVMSRDVVAPTQRLRKLQPEQAKSIAACRKCRLEDLLDSFRGGLSTVLLKGLARQPDARYQSPAALAADLQ